ncbi:MAG: hypothetical protein ACUVRG_11255 [Ignavibacterium sp.]|uniref:hypothetical protein n=1 Tax=Ignavibacterium sp. TaxID=2651167 RepID=UPI004049DC0C
MNVLYNNLDYVNDYDIVIINASNIYQKLNDIVERIKLKNSKQKFGFIILKYPSKTIPINESDSIPSIKILSKPVRLKSLIEVVDTTINSRSVLTTSKQLSPEVAETLSEPTRLKILLAKDNSINPDGCNKND